MLSDSGKFKMKSFHFVNYGFYTVWNNSIESTISKHLDGSVTENIKLLYTESVWISRKAK